VIAAAGSGQRLGAGGPKALVELAGRPMIAWSLVALAAAETIERIVIAAPPGYEGQIEEAARGAPKPVEVVSGGESRAESVRLAMEVVGSELVAIHDAARPLLTPELIDRIVGRLARSEADGVIVAAPVADTLKRAGEGGSIRGTVDRVGLWSAQTPQVFRANVLRDAQRAARESGDLAAATDEAWLLERAGGMVLLEEAEISNLKVTTAADVAIAEALLARRSTGT